MTSLEYFIEEATHAWEANMASAGKSRELWATVLLLAHAVQETISPALTTPAKEHRGPGPHHASDNCRPDRQELSRGIQDGDDDKNS